MIRNCRLVFMHHTSYPLIGTCSATDLQCLRVKCLDWLSSLPDSESLSTAIWGLSDTAIARALSKHAENSGIVAFSKCSHFARPLLCPFVVAYTINFTHRHCVLTLNHCIPLKSAPRHVAVNCGHSGMASCSPFLRGTKMHFTLEPHSPATGTNTNFSLGRT